MYISVVHAQRLCFPNPVSIARSVAKNKPALRAPVSNPCAPVRLCIVISTLCPKGFRNDCLNGQSVKSSLNGGKDRPGLPPRPRPPGSLLPAGVFNETPFEGNLVRGLLAVRSTKRAGDLKQGVLNPCGGIRSVLCCKPVGCRSTGYQPKRASLKQDPARFWF